MRSRNLKPAIFKNELLAVDDPLYTVIFEGLWCMADREGRLEDRPAKIHMEVNPGRAFEGTERSLAWLHEHGFILRATVGLAPLIQVIAFKRHQTPHKNEVASVLPPILEGSEHRKLPYEAQPRTEVHTAKDESASDQGDKHFALTPSSLTPDSGLLTPDSLNPDSVRKPSVPEDVNAVALAMWLEYRQAAKKPIKPYSMAALHKKLAKLGDHVAQLAAVEHSIANQYAGLYAESYTNGSGKPRKARFEELTDNAPDGAHEDQGFG